MFVWEGIPYHTSQCRYVDISIAGSTLQLLVNLRVGLEPWTRGATVQCHNHLTTRPHKIVLLLRKLSYQN